MISGNLFKGLLRMPACFGSTFQSMPSRSMVTKPPAIAEDKRTDISYWGDPYATTVRRRRQISNPSELAWDKAECLKWAKWSMRKEVKKRHLNSWYWQYRHNMQNLAYCKSLPTIVTSLAVEERNATPRGSSINQIVNRCSMTSRARGKVYKYRLSRMVWRDLADHGLLSGLIRAKWG